MAARLRSGFTVLLLDRTGRVQRRRVGRDFAFLADGSLVLLRGRELLLVRADRWRRLTTADELERAAGFSASYYGGLRFVHGYGPDRVVLQWWSASRSVLLAVSRTGAVAPVTPVFGRDSYMPGYASWSPDGRVLLIPWQRPARDHAEAGHIHCLARWTRARGYRSVFCRNPHFDTLVWHPDGGTALMDDSRIVGRDGGVRARVGKLGRALGVRWTAAR